MGYRHRLETKKPKKVAKKGVKRSNFGFGWKR